MQKYSVIVADPPWQFKVWNRDTGQGRSAEAHYRTMTIADICAMPIPDLAEKNCALFLWCVWPSIFDFVPRLLAAWGFKYKTCAFMWVKAKKSGMGHFTGMGYYTRANSEPCLLAVRGSMPVVSHSVSQIVYSPVRKHSQKPDVYDLIERLYPAGKRLELFARQPWPGWDRWGNEVEGGIDMTEYSKF